MKKLSILLAGVALAVTMMWGIQSMAYEVFDGNNNCSQCHTTFVGFGASHNFHTAFASCLDCHITVGDNPFIAKCAVCHEKNVLWNRHIDFAPPDTLGIRCNACHSVVGNEAWTWGETKNTYR